MVRLPRCIRLMARWPPLDHARAPASTAPGPCRRDAAPPRARGGQPASLLRSCPTEIAIATTACTNFVSSYDALPCKQQEKKQARRAQRQENQQEIGTATGKEQAITGP